MKRDYALIKHTHYVDDLYDVTITAIANGDLLQYNSSTGVWANIAVASLAGLGEAVQDIVGAFATDSSRIDFTYSDVGNTLTADIIADSVSNTYLANMADTTIKGRAVGAGTGDPTDLTAAQLITIINTADGSGSGLDADLLDGVSSSGYAASGVTLTAGAGLTGGGDLTASRTFAVGAGTGITVNADDVAIANTAVTPASYTYSSITVDQQGRLTAASSGAAPALAATTITAGAGLTGGGDLSSNRTIDVGAGTGITVNANDVALDTSSDYNVAHSGVTLTAGAGLTGGGTIAASRTFAVGAGTGITVNADDIALTATAVTPASYTNTDLTVDAYGRITAAASGTVALGSEVSGDLPLANIVQGTALSVLGVTGNATADYADIVAASDKQVLRRSGTAVAFGAVDLASTAAVTGNLSVNNLNSGTNADNTHYWRGDGTWATVAGGSLANPTGTIGLTAVNGVATDGIRSDGAPALSQAIAPTWTELHKFSKTFGTVNGAISLESAVPMLTLVETDAAANAQRWWMYVNGGVFHIDPVLDDGSVNKQGIAITRTAGDVSAISFGNATGNPTYSFLGTGTATFGGVVHTDSYIELPSANATYILTTGNASSANSLSLQCGAGSTSFGGGIVMYAGAHATYPGSVWIGRASGGGDIKFGIGGWGVGTEWAKFTLNTNAQLQGTDGAAGTPFYTFLSDTDTGMYRSGTNELAFATGGTQYLRVNSSYVYCSAPQMLSVSGTVSVCGYAFDVDGDTGLYRIGTNNAGMATAGVLVQEWGSGYTAFSTQVRFNNIISPTQIAANTNDWNPTGLATANVIRISSDASRNLTGIVAQTTGTVIILSNIGGFAITLVHDATSTAGNRFLCTASTNYALSVNKSVMIWYDGTSSRWRVGMGA